MWDSAPLREALARTDMGAVVAILRGAMGMSQMQFGELLGWSQSIVTRVERNERRKAYDIAEILAIVDALGMPREALLPLILGRADVTLDSEEEAVFWGVGDVDRREFNRLAVGAAVGAILPLPDRVDRGHIRYLQACLDKLRSRDRTAGGGGLLTEAVRVHQRARLMLDESSFTEQIGRELLVVTADLGIIAAWLAYDAGNQPLARSLYEEAELLAGSAGTPELQVHVYANLAQQSTYLAKTTGRKGRAREALRFADRAADAARHEPSPALHSLIALRQALAHAQLGDDVAFRAAISRARRELDRGRRGDEPSWTAFVSHSEICGYEALGSFVLGRPGKAAGLYLDVLKDPARSPRDRAYYRACLSSALCEDGDRKAAVSEALLVLPELDEGGLASMRVLAALEPVRTTVGDQAEEFTARYDSAARALAAVAG